MSPLVIAYAQDDTIHYNAHGVEWDANDETDLWGYRVYKAKTSDGHVKGEEHAVMSIPAGVENYVFPTDHPEGKFWWRATAIDFAKNESGFSIEEVIVEFDRTPPANPVGCSVMMEPEPMADPSGSPPIVGPGGENPDS
jgi:hypothetical protein